MIVSELIEKLKQFPPDTTVLCENEGMRVDIKNVTLEECPGKGIFPVEIKAKLPQYVLLE